MSPRSDAVRSRERILDAARNEPGELRLNEVARRAGVGVGTVYRHFPTVHALTEALATGDLERYRDLARRAAAEPDPAAALELLVREGLALQLSDGSLQAVLLASEDASAEVQALKRELGEVTAAVVDAARRAGVVRDDLTMDALRHLVCGVEYAVRVGGGEGRDFFLDVVLAGLRSRPLAE
ncbi:MAG: TetR/AcrR family transcriptional regulator [Promicromonosporaceae bacterium]|nr:TetR/AcrR family transcriptional regulator [Promicromonosporaceae bacterium]